MSVRDCSWPHFEQTNIWASISMTPPSGAIILNRSSPSQSSQCIDGGGSTRLRKYHFLSSDMRRDEAEGRSKGSRSKAIWGKAERFGMAGRLREESSLYH
jgi:hypothetical protein